MEKMIRSALNWRLRVKLDEVTNLFYVTKRSDILFSGNKKECEEFLKKHTIISLVDTRELEQVA